MKATQETIKFLKCHQATPMAAPDTADSVDSDKETMKCNLYANEMLIYKTKIQ